jgi:hypothetical protein
MPFVMKFSGWPGVMEFHWRKFLRSSFCGGARKEGRGGERGEVRLDVAEGRIYRGRKKRAFAHERRRNSSRLAFEAAEWIFRVGSRATRARAARAAPSVSSSRGGTETRAKVIVSRRAFASRRARRRAGVVAERRRHRAAESPG